MVEDSKQVYRVEECKSNESAPYKLNEGTTYKRKSTARIGCATKAEECGWTLMMEWVRGYARKGHVGKIKARRGNSTSSRIAALVAGILPSVPGDGVLVSRAARTGIIANGWCTGSAANWRWGRCAAKVGDAKTASSASRTRGFLAGAAEKFLARSERYLAVPAAARQGTALGAHDCGHWSDGGLDRRRSARYAVLPAHPDI